MPLVSDLVTERAERSEERNRRWLLVAAVLLLLLLSLPLYPFVQSVALRSGAGLTGGSCGISFHRRITGSE